MYRITTSYGETSNGVVVTEAPYRFWSTCMEPLRGYSIPAETIESESLLPLDRSAVIEKNDNPNGRGQPFELQPFEIEAK